MAMLALTGPGDEVIIPEPAWNHYAALTQLAGSTHVPLPLRAEDGFRLDPERLAKVITPRTKLLVVNSPSNPTGAVQTECDLQAIANLAEKHGFYVLSDEVYKEFVFAGQHVSMLSNMRGSPWLIYLDSFSKSFALTGWRLGYCIADASVSDLLNRVHQYLTVCGVPFVQRGVLAALRHPGLLTYLTDLRTAFAKRRAIWIDAFGSAFVAPKGAFYFFPQLTIGGRSGVDLCTWLLEEHDIATVPGEVFGAEFKNYLRISYGGSEDEQRHAATTIKRLMEGKPA
jgi:aminotransferase